MKSIGDGRVLDGLVQRLERLGPDTERRWGVMTAGEMLCHLGDATDAVLGRRVPPGPVQSNVLPRPIAWALLYTPVPFPKGVATRPGVNPHLQGTRPGDFARDRARAVEGLGALAGAQAADVQPTHFRFGPMSLRAWHHWAYKHTDHHLRQFGA